MEEDKLERKKIKEQRNYEIFDSMPYKFETKKFKMNERHPISKMRYENAVKYIVNQWATEENHDHSFALELIEKINNWKANNQFIVNL